METRKSCNNCGKDGHCKAARSPLGIRGERDGFLVCFIPPKIKNFKFIDCISKVVIDNPNNYIIQWLKEY